MPLNSAFRKIFLRPNASTSPGRPWGEDQPEQHRDHDEDRERPEGVAVDEASHCGGLLRICDIMVVRSRQATRYASVPLRLTSCHASCTSCASAVSSALCISHLVLFNQQYHCSLLQRVNVPSLSTIVLHRRRASPGPAGRYPHLHSTRLTSSCVAPGSKAPDAHGPRSPSQSAGQPTSARRGSSHPAFHASQMGHSRSESLTPQHFASCPIHGIEDGLDINLVGAKGEWLHRSSKRLCLAYGRQRGKGSVERGYAAPIEASTVAAARPRRTGVSRTTADCVPDRPAPEYASGARVFRHSHPP